jgi:hypothetical protein
VASKVLVDRSIHEPARDVGREMAKRSAYRQSRRDRRKVEMLFAHFKRILTMDRLRLQGITGARDEFLLAAIAEHPGENLRPVCDNDLTTQLDRPGAER